MDSLPEGKNTRCKVTFQEWVSEKIFCMIEKIREVLNELYGEPWEVI